MQPYSGKRTVDLIAAGTACLARPGVTGLSQLLAGRNARYSRRLERLYLRRQSFWFDLRLIALSFAVNLVGKRVVRKWLAR